MKSKAELQITNNQYMDKKRKRNSAQRELDDTTSELKKESQMTQMHKTSIENNQNEIEERKKTIAEKITRINQLQKKTQELEKFKFVLDYKIKELKRDFGPREVEIQKLKEQTAKMEQEMTHFKKVNSNLWLIVEDLRMR